MSRLRTASILYVLILAGAMVLTAATISNAAPSERLAGGAKVDRPTFDARWRSVVHVEPRSKFHTLLDSEDGCIGTLVAPSLVLTPQECAFDGVPVAQELSVRGATRRVGFGKRQYGDRVDVVEIIRNPRASTLPGGHAHLHQRVALLRLARPIVGGVPIRMAGASDTALWGGGLGRSAGVFAASWTGEPVDDDEDYSDEERRPRADIELNAVELPILPTSTCRTESMFVEYTADEFDPGAQLCVGRSRPKVVNACDDDSGSPVITLGSAGEPVLLGVVETGDYDCGSASIVTRIEAMQPWISAVRADVQSGRTGPSAATGLMPTLLPDGNFRLTWTATDTTIMQQEAIRPITVIERYPGLVSIYPAGVAKIIARQWERVRRIRLVAPGVTSVTGAGLHPVGTDPRLRASFAVVVEDGLGRTTMSDIARLQPPIDKQPPTRPRGLRSKLNRYGIPSITWASSRDDDCVALFSLEYRRFGGRVWGDQDDRYTSDATCRPGVVARPDDDYAPFDIGMFERTRGWYHVRVVAHDRAGNRAPSAPLAVYVPRDIEDLDLDDECDLRGERVLCDYPLEDFISSDYDE